MKLVSWNVLQGGGERTTAQIEALMAQSPDIVTLQEVTARTAPIYRKLLAQAGLRYTVDSFQLAVDPTLLIGPRRYGELIASRWTLESLTPTNFNVPWSERVLSAVVETALGLVEVHTTHIPPGVTNGWIKIETLIGIFNRLACKANNPRILCGDFNTPKLERSDGILVTWGQKIRSNGEIITCKPEWDLGERNVIQGLSQFDLPDVFRLIHGYSVQDFSWYWRGRGRCIGRRLDHVFASAQLNAVSCKYLHLLREAKLSDHSPIEVCFSLNQTRLELKST